MNRTKQVFVILRDSGKILVTEEIRKEWETRFLKEGDRQPSVHQFANWLWRAYSAGLVWRIARGVYQAKAAETNESIYVVAE